MSRAPIRSALAARSTRLRRPGETPAPLESLAAEFALLAQRRGRVRRQMALLDRQREAADTTLRQVEHRLAALSRRMQPELAPPREASQARHLPLAPSPLPPPPLASPTLAPPTLAPPPPEPPAALPPRPLLRGSRRRMVLEY